MYRLSANGFTHSNGTEQAAIRLGALDAPSPAWNERQGNAVPGYADELQKETPESNILYRLFSCYLAEVLWNRRPAKILDAGCGMATRYPPYIEPIRQGISTNGSTYVGLDPIPENVTGREYPFICGRLEDLPAVLADRFDCFAFSTSLDHFEDLEKAAAAVRALAAPRAVAVFWIGLHDPKLVAEDMGRKWAGQLYTSLNPLHFLVKAAGVSLLMFWRYVRLLARARRLRRGTPLDNLHFYYFTESNLPAHLEKFGPIRDITHVPGTNSVFATVEVARSAP